MEKVDKCKTKWIISKRSCKKESNGNARNKKHSKKKNNMLDRHDTAQERIIEHEDHIY